MLMRTLRLSLMVLAALVLTPNRARATGEIENGPGLPDQDTRLGQTNEELKLRHHVTVSDGEIAQTPLPSTDEQDERVALKKKVLLSDGESAETGSPPAPAPAAPPTTERKN